MVNLSDEAIGRQVEQAIGFDPRANVFDMRVYVRDGVVRLEGIVSNLEAKLAAGSAAAGVPGIRRVDNTLTVEDPRGLSDPGISDAVEDALVADPQVDAYKVGASVLDGTAHLVGYADSAADEQSAIRAASRADGVKGIVSEIDVSPGQDIDWVDIRNRVTDALDEPDDLYPYTMDVAVETDGRVVLTGDVAAEHDRERAERIARGVDGVKEVVNRLAVRGR